MLGGDGTLIGTAGRIANAGVDIPILGVNFGSLGFLTEITLPELYASLEAVLDGDGADRRAPDAARADAAAAATSSPTASSLNDVVITKGALSRIIDLVGVDRRAAR